MDEHSDLIAAALAWARVRRRMSRAAAEVRVKNASSGPETPTRRQMLDVEAALARAAERWL